MNQVLREDFDRIAEQVDLRRVNGKTVLITGSHGFIGSYLMRMFDYFEICYVHGIDNFIAGEKDSLADIRSDQIHLHPIDIASEFALIRLRADYVLHAASIAAPMFYKKYPIETVRANVRGTWNVLDWAVKSKPVSVVHFSCYDNQTRALTPNGFKTLDELKVGSNVLSLNPITHEIEIKPITRVVIQEYIGPMIYFRNKRVDLLVTPNHKMFIKDRGGNLKIEDAAVTAKRSTFRMPRGIWKGLNIDGINLQGLGAVALDDILYIIGVFIGDGITAFQEKRQLSKTGLARAEYLQAAKSKISGRFETIPHSGIQRDIISKSHRVFLYVPKKDKARSHIEKTLTRLGVKWHSHGDIAIYFSCESLMRLFDQCGKWAENKYIPAWCLEFAPEHLEALYDGLMDSDGHTGRIPYYVTVSKTLAANFCELLLKTGRVPYVHTNPPSVSFIKGRKIICRESYHIAVGRTSKSLLRKRVKIVEYNGLIWCVSVADNHNLLVERNGRIDFCGNSSEVYGDPSNIPTPESYWGHTSFTGPRAVYDESKRFSETLCVTYHRQFGVPVKVVRPFNICGPGMRLDDERVIPNLMKAILNDEVFTIYGDGSDTRSFCYISDAVAQILAVMLDGENGEAYNVGYDMEISLNELGRLAQVTFDGKPMVEHIEGAEARKDAPKRRRPDISKVLKIAPKPVHDLRSGLERTLKSYKNGQD